MQSSEGVSLVRYVLETDHSTLPREVTERTKMLVFDQIGCSLVGMELPSGELALRYAQANGGSDESSVFRSASRLPAAHAAWVNGTSGHAAELDCPHATADFRATGHPAAVIVPAALAVAERQHSSGSDLVQAVAAGFEAGARTVSVTGGLPRMRAEHGLYGGCLHSIGAALSSTRLLGLDLQQSLHACALSVGQALSPVGFFGERRHMSKSVTKGGQPAFAGVAGALQAAFGLEGVDDIFTCDGGIVATWGEPGREGELTRGLGQDHAVMGANFKFYAAGYPIHAAAEAALRLVAEHGLDAEDIEGVSVGMPRFAALTVDSRDMPTISMQAMLSVAVVAGRLGFEEAHSDALLRDSRVVRLRSLVTVEVDSELERVQPHGRGARVTIRTRNGTYTSLVEHPKGHRFRPEGVSWADLREKWEPLLVSRLGASRFGALLRTCRSLDAVDDVREIAALLQD